MKKLLSLRGFSFMRLTFLAIAMVFVISYLSVCKLLYVGKGLMVQGKNMSVLAEEIRTELIEKLHAQKFSCPGEKNITLAGLIIERPNAVGTVLLCHGYKCCKELTAGYIDFFENFNIVMFDFRGHGENKKTLTTIGCHEYKDVISVASWIKKEKPEWSKIPFVILGSSMGGAASLKAVEQDPTLCDALIVDSSFASLKTLLHNTFTTRSGLPAFPFFPIMKRMFNYLGACDLDSFKPIESIKKIKQPLLLIHSCVDEYVPVQASLLMYAQGEKTGAKLWITPQCKHGYIHKDYPELYKKKVTKFLQKRVFKTT